MLKRSSRLMTFVLAGPLLVLAILKFVEREWTDAFAWLLITSALMAFGERKWIVPIRPKSSRQLLAALLYLGGLSILAASSIYRYLGKG